MHEIGDISKLTKKLHAAAITEIVQADIAQVNCAPFVVKLVATLMKNIVNNETAMFKEIELKWSGER